ncbi:MAG: asparaginase [Fretibacterium sp.]|nr:asparaginase [Fretibacterium sp.]
MPNRNKVTLLLAGGQVVHRKSATPTEPTENIPLTREEVEAALGDVAQEVEIMEWSFQPISHYSLRMCSDLVQLAASQVKEGAQGVVITFDTQALTEFAYFADQVWSFPQPLIFTGSLLYSGLPGSETALNLTQSVQAALSESCWGQGVIVCIQDRGYAASEIHQLSNDNRSGLLLSPCGPLFEFSMPLGELRCLRKNNRNVLWNTDTVPARSIEIVEAFIGGGDLLLNALLEKHINELDGLVVGGFGNGDVPPSWVPLLRNFLRADVPVVLASRCLTGRVQRCADFEGSATRLLEMGLISAGSLSTRQARIRLALGLGGGLEGSALKNYMKGE